MARHRTVIATAVDTVYRTTLFLERSKGYPLSLAITNWNAHTLIAIPAFAALEVSIPRWKFLSIALRTLSAFSHGNIFSSLEHLVIYSTRTTSNVNLDLFEAKKVPSLRVLETRSSIPWRVFHQVSLPWSQLTTFRDFSAFDQDGLDFLQQSTNLTDLGVTLGEACRSFGGAVVRLPNVFRFEITEDAGAAPRSLEEVFKTLELPSLSELSLSFSFKDGVNFFPDLFVGGCKRLVKLHINLGLALNADNSSNLLRFLSCTPCVQDLCLDDRLSVEFIVGLTLTPVSKRLPHLHILDFGACYRTVDLIDDTPVIYDMIESRYLQLEEGVKAEDTQFGSMVDVTMSSSSSISRVERPSSCMERVRVPRWLFFKEDQRWKDICGAIKVECGIVMKDAK
ncbi:hypothetical protein CPB85DRAFT_987494 [Mucidula mucida]|nr:hypothetical protein CPB85DRAFT_987494 [Mucidula mucida]